MKLLIILPLATVTAFAQMPGPQYNPTAARTARLFGKDFGFTANARMSTKESGDAETINEMDYAVRDGMVHIQMDLTKSTTDRKSVV